jgi:hypothetical protein
VTRGTSTQQPWIDLQIDAAHAAKEEAMSVFLIALLTAGVIGGLDHNIVTPARLEQNLDDPYVVVVEIGSQAIGDHPHIPGARFVAIESIVKREGWPPDELPPVEDLRRAFQNAGVGEARRSRIAPGHRRA